MHRGEKIEGIYLVTAALLPNHKILIKLKKMNIVKSLVEGYSKINTATRFGPIELLSSCQFHHNLEK